MTVETCPHYVLLTSEDMGRLGSVLRRGRVVMREGELVGEPGWGGPVVPARAVTVA